MEIKERDSGVKSWGDTDLGTATGTLGLNDIVHGVIIGRKEEGPRPRHSNTEGRGSEGELGKEQPAGWAEKQSKEASEKQEL